MKILSDNTKFLDEIFNDLNRKKIKPQKGTKKLDGAMGNVYTRERYQSVQEIEKELYPSFFNNIFKVFNSK